MEKNMITFDDIPHACVFTLLFFGWDKTYVGNPKNAPTKNQTQKKKNKGNQKCTKKQKNQ